MSIKNRPYVGTWELNQQGVIRHTPDALVYINGSLEIAGCPTCGGRVDLQKFITAVSVEAGTDTGAGSASITLHIPRHEGHSFFRDGQFILKPGLEVNVYFRGYFPVQGLLSDVQPTTTGGVDVQNAVMYPYYHVFHGVVTETSYEYSGGEHTASLNCQDLLHFWNYQLFSTKGSYFGERPAGSKINTTLMSSALEQATPYGIIYTLYRVGMGAAGGVGRTISGQTTSMKAMSEDGQSLWAMASLYWEKRFSENFMSLRMYGLDGTLYNAYQQAFVGSLSTGNNKVLATTFADPSRKLTGNEPFTNPLAETARLVGYDPASTFLSQKSEKDAAKGGLGINAMQMQAYTFDVSGIGAALMESNYETKMDIAAKVAELTNFEFYQDVDGDFVFKPPFYNLDTHTSRTYVIKDIDLISISFTEAEPEVTALKATSPAFGNTTGLSLTGDMGKSATYIDYRLVAQFGWRENTFETAYAGDTRAMFYTCVSRMDLFNLDINRAQCQIPIRPELRPGYPVYLESFDCFYYLKSFSHSLSFGGQCTTSLTLTGRRAKFYAPGSAPQGGSKATVEDIFLSDPWLPSLPLEVKGNDQIPRLQGFPNVVMTVDSELLNPAAFTVGSHLSKLTSEASIRSLVLKARMMGILETDEEQAGGKSSREKWFEGPFEVRTGRGTTAKIGSAAELLAQAKSYQQAYEKQNTDARNLVSIGETTIDENVASETAAGVLALVLAMEAKNQTAIEDDTQIANYLDMLANQKDRFAPDVPGYYRYYSSSHPDPTEQGMKEVVADANIEDTTQAAGLVLLDSPEKVRGFKTGGDGQTTLEEITVTAGIPIMRPNTGTDALARAVPTPTHQIAGLSFAQFVSNTSINVPRQSGKTWRSYSWGKVRDIIQPQFVVNASRGDTSASVADRFKDTYIAFATAVNDIPFLLTLDNPKGTTILTFDQIFKSENRPPKGNKKPYYRVPIDPNLSVAEQYLGESNGLKTLAKHLASHLARVAATAFSNRYKELKAEHGKPGAKRGTKAEQAANAQAYSTLDNQWAFLLSELAGDDGDIDVSDNGKNYVVQVPSFNETSKYAPVFPVSDGRGYEVIGTLPYGRGLSIEDGGGIRELFRTSPFDFVSVAAIEEFIQSLRTTGSTSHALGALAGVDIDLAASLAEAASSASGSGKTGDEALKEVTDDPTILDKAFSNYITSSRDSTQKLTVTNAAYGLADMGLHTSRSVCSCKGAEADVLLMAYGEQGFLSTDAPDKVTAWLQDQAFEAQQSWQVAQDALRGQVLDTRQRDLAESFKRAKNQFLTGVNAGVDDLNQAVGDLNQAGADVAANAQEVVQLRDDAQAFLDFFNPNPDEG